MHTSFPLQDEIGETAVTAMVAAFPGDDGQVEVHVEVGSPLEE